MATHQDVLEAVSICCIVFHQTAKLPCCITLHHVAKTKFGASPQLYTSTVIMEANQEKVDTPELLKKLIEEKKQLSDQNASDPKEEGE